MGTFDFTFAAGLRRLPLLLAALVGCDLTTVDVSAIDLGEAQIASWLEQDGDIWQVGATTSFCTAGNVGDELRLRIGYEGPDGGVHHWTVTTAEVTSRDGCVELAGELDLPLRAQVLDRLPISVHIQQLQDGFPVDGFHGAGCATASSVTDLDLSYDLVTRACG